MAQPQAAPSPPPDGDFWDGFRSEEQQAGVQPPVPPSGDGTAVGEEPTVDFELEDRDGADDAPKVGGWGSGLFTEEDDGEPVYPPAFGRLDEGAAGENRGWSYYDDDGDTAEGDRGWSYDDPAPVKKAAVAEEDPPEFRSPSADREELVEKSSRMKDIASWRPSMPSFALGGSSIGMRARDAIEVLDAILEENGTEDIPRSFIVGLGALVAVLALLALIAVIF
jgi:hypothetical protein